MATTARAVTAGTLGAWLLKTRGDVAEADELVVGGAAERCVRRSYRTDLVAPGQPVLLWVSGSSRARPAGLHAQGRTTGPATPRTDVADGRLVVPVTLRPLTEPVLRGDLLLHPVLSQLEVLRMPAGSNPSYLDRVQLEALRSAWPQVSVR